MSSRFAEIGGSKKFIQWIESYNGKENKSFNVDIKKYHLLREYDIYPMIAEFDNNKFNYGVLFYNDGNDPQYVSFGQTYDSYDGEYRSYFINYLDLQKEYDNVMGLFNNLEKILHSMIHKKLITLTTINTIQGTTEVTFYNIMILSVIVNLNVKNIINGLYESHMSPTFIKLINYIYDYDSSVLVNPYMKIENQLGSKVTPIENINDFNHYEFIEIDINIRISSIIKNNNATMFPLFIDWIFIKPLTNDFFNNKLLKDNMSDIIDIYKFIKKDNTKLLGQSVGKNIETHIGTLFVNQYVGHTMSDIFTFYKKSPIEPCHIFELMYGLYVLHVNNIIHGDICLTNLTFQEKQNMKGVNVFILSEYGEIDTYVFDSNSINCYIIDFSKPIINTKFLEERTKSQIYCQKQNTRIQSLVEQYIQINTLSEIDSIFPALCFIDYINLSNCLQILFKDTNVGSLLVQLEKIATEMLTKNIKLMTENLELDLFKQLFSSYSFVNDDINLPINSIQYI